MRSLFALIVILSVSPTIAATRYVDSSATGANNGTSWTDAWTTLPTILTSELHAGDTVYISGGTTSKEYPASDWHVKSGTLGAPITYQIGQEAGHNGIAIFDADGGQWLDDGSGGNFVMNYVTLSGHVVGDSLMHFVITNLACPINMGQRSDGVNPGTGIKLLYIDFGRFNYGMSIWYSKMVEIGYCRFYKTVNIYPNSQAGSWVFTSYGSSLTGYGSNSVHDCTLFLPRFKISEPIGDDGLSIHGYSWDIYNNRFESYSGSAYYTETGQHMDAIVMAYGAYYRIYNNQFYGMGDSCIYIDIYQGDFNHGLVYNNVAMTVHTNAWFLDRLVDGQVVTASAHTGISLVDYGDMGNGAKMISDLLIANNTIVDIPGTAFEGVHATPPEGTYINCVFANNLAIHCSQPFSIIGTIADVYNFGNADIYYGTNIFVSYTHFASTNNNLRPKLTATDVVGQGTNLSAFFTTDIEGNARPATGAWDIGAYQSDGVAPTNPIILVSQPDPSFQNTLIGSTNTSYIAVKNVGMGTLNGTGSVSSPFFFTTSATYSLTNLETKQITCEFRPTISGYYTRNASFTGGGGTTLIFGANGFNFLGESFNAIDGFIISPFFTNGGFVSQSVNTASDPVTGGRAIYKFFLTNSGNYNIQARVSAPSEAENSIWIGINEEPNTDNYIWDIPTFVGYTNRLAAWRGSGTTTNNEFIPKTWTNLLSGSNELIIIGREPNVGLLNFSLIAAETNAPNEEEPFILTQPSSTNVTSGRRATFLVSASGTPTLLYQWKFNGTNISGATTTSYAINAVATSDAGSYTVTVTNDTGSVTSTPAILTVDVPPYLLAQLIPQTNIVGGSLHYQCDAGGTPPLSYQWYFNGIAIQGITSASGTFAGLATNNTGDYSVRVSNPFGFVESLPARLTIAWPPYIISQSTNQNRVILRSNFTFSVTAGGFNPLIYQWKLNNTNIFLASGSSITYPAFSFYAGSYTCIITNIAGSITSSPITITNIIIPPTTPVQLSVAPH